MVSVRQAGFQFGANSLEVNAIAVEHGATIDTIGDIARRKRAHRGGFDMRLCLVGIDEKTVTS